MIRRLGAKGTVLASRVSRSYVGSVVPGVRPFSMFSRTVNSLYSSLPRGPPTVALLRALETCANRDPRDIAWQTVYSQALYNAELHREVVNRMESGRFVCNPHSLELYVKSLVATRALGENARSSVQNALRRAWERGEKSGGGGALLQPSEVRAAVQTGVGEWGVGGGGGGQSLYPAGGSSTLFPSNPSSSSSATSFSDALGSRANPLHTRDMTNQINPFFRMLMYGASLGLLYYAFNTSMKGGALPGVGGGLGSIMGGPDIAEEISNVPSTRFEDVKGADEAKHELEDIVRFLKDPEKYSRLGAKVPSGVLLTGPPGTGKTLLARAVAGEAGCHFYSKSASEFEEMLVGLGARRVRDLFAAAKKNSPSIIFIDEIDALGGKRRGGGVGGQDRERQTLNQLLSCMDGFSKNEGVIVIAATNAPEILDPALTRPGRFDSMVDVSLPDVKGRREILEYYLEKTVVGPGINSDILAKATPGFSGAQLEAMVNSAALMAASRDAEAVEMRDMEEARDKLIMGPSKVSRVITPAVKRLTAYHEGGHTLINLLSSASPPLHKVTILPRGMSGGATYNLPKEDMRTKTDMLAMIDIALGGRVAEELVFGADNVTTGASSDFQQASSLARSYILQLSMSDIGMSSFDPQFGISEVRRAAVDEEVERMLKDSYARVKALLTRNRPALDRLADALIEHETLTAEECKLAVAGEIIPAKVVVAAPSPKPAPAKIAKKAAPTSKPLPKPKMSPVVSSREREGVTTPSSAMSKEGGKGADTTSTTTHRIWPFGTLVIKRKDSTSSSGSSRGGGGGGGASTDKSPKDPKEIEAEIQRLQAALVTAQEEVSRGSGEEEGKGGEKQRV